MGTPDAYPFRTLPAPVRFGIALAALGCVFLIAWLGGTAIDDGSHFLLLGIAVMASAWFGGTGPALAITVLGAVLGAMEIGKSPNPSATATHLAIFLAQGLLLTALVSELRSARRVAEEQARVAQIARREGEAANRMKDEFLATVSHELRTPLNAVLGWVHLLRTGKLDGPTVSRGLESIERNVRLQAQVTTDLLDVSKALTGQLLLESQLLRLGDPVQQAIASVAAAARAKGVSIHTVQPEQPVAVLGDPSRLRQIVWHLVANAIKFTPRGGRIEVSIDTVGDEALLTVADSGRGIDPTFLPRIFERFTQADGSPTRIAGGLGVGLALVRELVEMHGGEIEARNATDHSGAVFTIRLPLQAAELIERVPKGELAIPRGGSPPLDGIRVLVLDQDAEACELLRTILQQRGATVRAVVSVAEALELLEGWRPDVLLSDTMSPSHDSYALVGKVHALDAERGGRIPALALTTFARTDERLAPLLADVHRDLPKPVEPGVLTSEIARLTGRERRRVAR